MLLRSSIEHLRARVEWRRADPLDQRRADDPSAVAQPLGGDALGGRQGAHVSSPAARVNIALESRPTRGEIPWPAATRSRARQKPSEQRGGTTPGRGRGSRERASGRRTAAEGIVPAELGGSDAPREMLGRGSRARELGARADDRLATSRRPRAASTRAAATTPTRRPTAGPTSPIRRSPTSRTSGPRPAKRSLAAGWREGLDIPGLG